MNKYKRLLSNTLIFAIGTFSSKVSVSFLTPLLSHALSPAEFSITNMIVDMGNLLLPIVTLGIVNSIIRFGLDRSVKSDVFFSMGFFTILFGFLLLLVLQPVIVPVLTPVMEVMRFELEYVSQYMMYLICFVGMSSMRSLFSQFTRARGLVRLFAVDGIISTFTTVLFSAPLRDGISHGRCGIYFRHHHVRYLLCDFPGHHFQKPALSAASAH